VEAKSEERKPSAERTGQDDENKDVFLLTSAFKAMPITILEALSCGLPVVSPDVGEVRRVVKNGISGIICAERTPETLSNAVLTVLKSSKFTPENCVHAIQDYTAKRILDDIYQCYHQLSRMK
jgi:glycosyltransferase involved in cell wall biosynthesis